MRVQYYSIHRVFKLIKGGPGRLRRLLIKHEQPAPSTNTISKWKRRNAIPSLWVGAVMWACAREGIDPLICLEDV